MTIKLTADENIPFAKEIFSKWGFVKLVNGRKLTQKDLLDQDALIIRSVTKVDQSLISNTPVKFVGTCTIGTDHVDQSLLKEKNITFFSAPGCNAQAVAEYVITQLLQISVQSKESLIGKTLGIIGVGNVGTIVNHYAKAIGLKTKLYDPPKEESCSAFKGTSFEDTLVSDFITLHVPFTKNGKHKTWHMINENSLKSIPQKTVLINSCRGEVIEQNSFLKAIKEGKINHPIIDVWENEPNINLDLVDLVKRGSPHVAGYTYDAKIRGATMIADHLADHLGTDRLDHNQFAEKSRDTLLIENEANWNLEQTILACCLKFFDPDIDHSNLLAMRKEGDTGLFFDNLRKNYRKRREFQTIPIKLKIPYNDKQLYQILRTLKFELVD